MFKTFINAWRVPELRKKILYTLLLLAIFRFGAFITAPGVDATLLNQITNTNSFVSTVNIITGGAFSNLSIFAMSISPYITASIIVQLLAFAIPALERISKDGETGRKKMSAYTRYASVILAAIEAFALYLTYRGQGIFLSNGYLAPLLFVLSLTAGSTLLMWIGEQISSKGVGNGISLLIFAGIVSGIPTTVQYLWGLIFVDGAFKFTGLLTALAVIIGAVLLVAGVVWVTEAERRVSVQYAKRVVGRKMYGGQSTYIPMKLNMAGVMPVIFAMSFLQFPAMIIQLFNNNIASSTGFWAGVYKVCAFTSIDWSGAATSSMIGYGIAHIIIYLILIVAFTFFYTIAMAFNTYDVSENLRKNGGFIPGIRAGKPTQDYLDSILHNITSFGAIFLGIIAVLPILTAFAGLQISFGGTAILIVVGVALESVKQLESQMLTRHYKGFLE